jgi:hypothetical protein
MEYIIKDPTNEPNAVVAASPTSKYLFPYTDAS